MMKKILLTTIVLLCMQPEGALFAQVQLGDDILGGSTGEWFSYGLSISGDGSRVVIGAPINSDSIQRAGQVRVREWSQNDWQPMGPPLTSGIRNARLGYDVAMSADGNHIIAGVPGYSLRTTNDPDFIRVYDWVNGSWTHSKPDIQADRGDDHAGTAVAISGNGSRIAFAAPYGDANGKNSGYVKAYEWSGSAWIQLGNTIAGQDSFDLIGRSIALSEDGLRLAIGEPSNDDSLSGGGRVRVFDWVNGNWVQMGRDIYGTVPSCMEGGSVALSQDGNIFATAATNWGLIGRPVTGMVRVFQWQNGAWNLMGSPVFGDSLTLGLGGGIPRGSLSISRDGQRFAAGAMRSNTPAGRGSGQVLVYDYVNNDWVSNVLPIYGDTASDHSGRSAMLSADGTHLAVGSINHRASGTMAGQVRVFDLTLRPTGITYAPQREDHEPVVYPNPTTGIIKLYREDRGTLTIIDNLGRLVFRKENPGEDPIDLEELPDGNYMVFLDKDGKRRMAKLIKQ